MFCLGFEKIAIDLKSAGKAAKRIYSKNVVRREAGSLSKNFNFTDGLGLSKTKHTIGPAFSQDSNKIHQSKDLSKSLNRLGVSDAGKTMSGSDKKLTNHLATIHEQAEKKFNAPRDGKISRKYFKDHRFAGHNHPGVIIEESNAVATLKNHDKVKDLNKAMRVKDQTKDTLERHIPGFKYGETRVSRHAKKRMSEIIAKKELVERQRAFMAANKGTRQSLDIEPTSLSEWKNHVNVLKQRYGKFSTKK